MYTTLLAVHWEQITMASSSIVYSTISGKIVLWFFLLVRSLLNFCFAIFFLCCFIGRFQVRRLCRPCHIVSITTPRVDHQASLAAEASFPCNNHDWFVFKLIIFFSYILYSPHTTWIDINFHCWIHCQGSFVWQPLSSDRERWKWGILNEKRVQLKFELENFISISTNERLIFLFLCNEMKERRNEASARERKKRFNASIGIGN